MKEIMKKFLVGKMEKDINEALDTFTPAADIYCTIMTPVGDFHFSNPGSWGEIKADESVFIIFDNVDEDRYLILSPLQPLTHEQWVHSLKGIMNNGELKLSVVTVLSNNGDEVLIKPLFKEAGEKVTILSYQKDTAEVVHRH